MYRVNFQREASIMSCLDDVNITRLHGVCFTDDPVCIVLEYQKFGDLKRFLRRHVVDATMTQRNGVDILRYLLLPPISSLFCVIRLYLIKTLTNRYIERLVCSQ